MESFHQIELLMMSKMEPTSPSSSSSNEDIIYEDNYANGKRKFNLIYLKTLLIDLCIFFVDHFINELNAMDELMATEHKKNVADILCELEGDKYLSEGMFLKIINNNHDKPVDMQLAKQYCICGPFMCLQINKPTT